MKKGSFLVAASFCLLSTGAFAGDNCLYGADKSLAEVAVKDALIADNSNAPVDPALLAVLKRQQAAKELVKPIATFN